MASLRRAWSSLTMPFVEYESALALQRARLVTAMLLVVIPLGSIIIGYELIVTRFHLSDDPDTIFSLVALVLLAVMYFVSRAGRSTLAAWTLIGLTVLVFVFSSFLPGSRDTLIFWSLIPVVLAATFFPVRAAFFVAASINVAILVLHQFYDTLSSRDVIDVMQFMLLGSGATLVFVTHRQTLERIRQAELEEANAHLITLMENTDDFILIGDQDGLPVVYNEAYSQLVKEVLGLDMKPGVQPHKLLQDRASVSFWDEMHRRVLGGETFRAEYSHQLPDGTLSHFDISFRPILEDGKVKGFSEVGRDITERKRAEEAYRSLVDHSLQALLIVQDERVVFANQAAVEMSGYTTNELLDLSSQSVQALIHPEDREFVWERARKRLAGEQTPERYEFRFVQKDGTVSWVEQYTSLIEYNGKPAAQTAYVDITERKQAEEALRESEERYRTVFEQSRDGISITARDGRIIAVNQAGLDIFGYTRDEVSEMNIVDAYVDPSDRAIFRRVTEEEGGIEDYELRLKKKDGTEMDCLINVSLWQSPDGTTKGYLGTCGDITERKQVEEALRESEARYRALFEHANDAIFTLREDRFIDCNERVMEYFGVTKEQIVGRTPFDFSPAEQPDGRDSKEKGLELIELALQGNPQRFEWRHSRHDGSLFDAEVSLNRVELPDEVLLHAIVRDVTDRKEAEEAAREERQRLARDLHDAVSQTLWSANLIAEVLPGLWEQDVATGRERLARLSQLIKGALAEMRALLLELRPGSLAQTPLDELLRNLADVTASRTQADVALRVDTECQLPHEVHNTLYRIAQEAMNNVTRHAAATEVEVQLRCEPDHVTLSVSDNGRGFDTLQTPAGQHLGLGIMRERADEIGATLEISSQPNRGTQITVTWSA